MEECQKLIKAAFPKINEEVYEYVANVLETSLEDFESGDDIQEAIGDILLELEEEKTETDVKDICWQIINILRPDFKQSTLLNNDQKLPDAPPPVLNEHFAYLDNITRVTVTNDTVNMKNPTEIDSKKLEKAEAMLKKKKNRKAKAKDKKAVNKYSSREATVSQLWNKRQADDGQETGASARFKRSEYKEGGSKDVHLVNFDISYGAKVLIEGADIWMVYGNKYGLVGKNGTGKTALLRMISQGILKIPSHISCHHVEQEVMGDDTTVLDSVLKSDIVREALLEEEESLNSKLDAGDTDPATSDRLTEVFEELEMIESAKAPARATMILTGLGFTPEMQEMATKTFSGGMRMRIALARALFCKPDLLMLDEPTNMQAVIWLEKYLLRWSSTILVVSHDRHFLDMIATDMLHLHNKKIHTFQGNYTAYLEAAESVSNQKFINDTQKYIDRYRYNHGKLLDGTISQKIKMLVNLPVLEEADVTFKFPEVNKLRPPILSLSEVSYTYGKGGMVLDSVDLCVTMESRICVVGSNGAGKTTLLKIIMDMLTPTVGTRSAHKHLRFGYFTQHFVDQLDLEVSPVEVLHKVLPGKTMEDYRKILGQFGITGKTALQQILHISGGQKARVAFAVLACEDPNCLILDEPTNHLDMQTIEALGKALLEFKGGVILVSHDERLLRLVCEELWVVANGKVKAVRGGVDEYRKMLEKQTCLES